MNRSPGVAGVLSVLLPGLGHLYAGATARGLAIAAAFVALIQAELVAGVLAVWILGIVNAIRTTEEIARVGGDPSRAAVSLDRNWAVGLMAVGVLGTLALIPDLEWAVQFWPLALVWIGLQRFRGRPLIPGAPAEPAAAAAETGATPDRAPAAATADPPPPPPAAAIAAEARADAAAGGD